MGCILLPDKNGGNGWACVLGLPGRPKAVDFRARFSHSCQLAPIAGSCLLPNHRINPPFFNREFSIFVVPWKFI
jgi:hypothetical protein